MTAPAKSWFDNMWQTLNKQIGDVEAQTKEDSLSAAIMHQALHQFVEAFEYLYIALGWE